jgi:hypothetical protein
MLGQLGNRLQFLAVIGVLLLGGALVFMAYKLGLSNSTPEVLLPLLVVGGVLSLLVVLSLVSVLFQTLGLADPKQALALPEGSVRAVIALSLVVLFAILSIFLYGSLSTSGKIQSLPNLTTEKKDEFVKNVPMAQVVLVQPTGTTFTVFYREPHNPAGEDFAKQLLVMLGTLVTAVASFYFGANTVASAHKAAKGGDNEGDPNGMSLEGIDKASAMQGESLSFKISGKGLGSVTEANFVRDDADPIPTVIGAKGPTQVSATAKIPDNAKTGSWNLEVKDAATTKTLAGKFEIKQRQG